MILVAVHLHITTDSNIGNIRNHNANESTDEIQDIHTHWRSVLCAPSSVGGVTATIGWVARVCREVWRDMFVWYTGLNRQTWFSVN